MHKLRTFVNSIVAQRSVTSWGAVDGIPVYLGSIRGEREATPQFMGVDIRAGHGRGYGPVTVSMVERISQVSEWIPDTSSISFRTCMCVLLPFKKNNML